MNAFYWYLQNVELFRGLPEESARKLAEGASIRSLPPEGPVTAGEAPSAWIAIVREGEVRAMGREEDGTEYPLGILGPGDFYGVYAFGDSESAGAKSEEPAASSSESASAESEGEKDATASTHLVAARFTRVLNFDEPAWNRISSLLAGAGPEISTLAFFRLRRKRTPVLSLVRRRARARVAAVILASAPGGSADVKFRRKELAHLSALGEDVFDFEIERFARAGAIAASIRSIRLLDPAALARAAEEQLPSLPVTDADSLAGPGPS